MHGREEYFLLFCFTCARTSDNFIINGKWFFFCYTTGTQTDAIPEVDTLMKRLEDSERRVNDLEASLAEPKLSAAMIKDDDFRTRLFTGLPSYPVFRALFEYLEPKASRMKYWSSKESENRRRNTHKLSLIDELFCCACETSSWAKCWIRGNDVQYSCNDIRSDFPYMDSFSVFGAFFPFPVPS